MEYFVPDVLLLQMTPLMILVADPTLHYMYQNTRNYLRITCSALEEEELDELAQEKSTFRTAKL